MGTHLLGCLQSGSWLLMCPLMPGTRASHLQEGCVELSRLRDTKLEGGFSPDLCDCPRLPPEWQRGACGGTKEIYSSKSCLQRVTTSLKCLTQQLPHLKPHIFQSTYVMYQRLPDLFELYACCGAHSVPYWKLKWRTGWGKRVFSSLYLVSASNQVHVPTVVSPGSEPATSGVLCRQQRAEDTGTFGRGES